MKKGVIMFIEIPKDGYWLKEDSIKKVEELRNARYMGYWCTKRSDGESWNETPVDVFYQPNPDIEAGHSNYFGLHIRDGTLFITDAKSCFSEPIIGSICEDGEIIVSRYRHDYIEKKGAMIDGGRDYTRTNGCKLILVEINGAEFSFKEFGDDDFVQDIAGPEGNN